MSVMNSEPTARSPWQKGTAATARFFTGPGLPVYILTVTLLYELFLLAVLFAPVDRGPWANFAVEFKVWCFSYDPRTGGMEWAAVWMMLLEPVFVALLVVLIWRRGLGSLFRPASWHLHLRPFLGGTGTAAAALTLLFLIGLPEDSSGEILPFPGERIRTQLTPPEFSLVDQYGEPVHLSGLRGHVVVMTGVYSRCTASCPHLLIELRTLLDDLPEAVRDELRILALSLDPEGDTGEMMQAVSRAYNFTYPQFRFLNGDTGVMRELLRRYHFSPVFNEKTGQIDHANLFILIDADGRIAYRFNLDPRHAPWLREAVIQLVEETGAFSASEESRLAASR
jgi:protein SCO1/2